MSFKLQTNFDRKQFSESTISNPIVRDDRLVESLRVLVKEYLEIVSFLIEFY